MLGEILGKASKHHYMHLQPSGVAETHVTIVD
jgi:hypothetical protein